MVFFPRSFISEYRPARKYSLFCSDGWWLNRWPLLGWLETFVKIAAWVFVPLISVDSATPVEFSKVSPVFFTQTLLMAIAATLLAAAIIDRLVYRELISIIFVFPNNWAHWKTLYLMYTYGPEGMNMRYFRLFCWLMCAGDVVKLVFFVVHDFSIALVAKYIVYSLVTLFAAIYAAVLMLEYGYFEKEAVLVHALFITRFRKTSFM